MAHKLEAQREKHKEIALLVNGGRVERETPDLLDPWSPST